MNHDNITQGRPENTHLGSSGPLEAPRGQTSHTIQNFNKCHFSKKFEILKFSQIQISKNIRFFLARMRLGVKRRWRQAWLPSAAAWLPTGSSWPERSEGHERSPAGVYIYVFDHPEGEGDR